MKYTIEEEKKEFNGYLKITSATITHDSFQNGKQIHTQRMTLDRGNAVAILIYEKDTDSFLFTKQFRYPTTFENIGWIYEIPAGMIENNESPEVTVCRETKEEIGYQIENPECIGSYYASPGCSTERVTIYFAEVTSSQKVTKGGGLDSEDEDILLHKVKQANIENFMNQEIIDAKSIIALQWYLLKKQA